MILYIFLLLGTCTNVSYSKEQALQEPIQTVEVGDSVNLTCLCTEKRITTIIWLRQKIGEKPCVIATSYQLQHPKFYNEFENSGRFDANIEPSSFNLSISKVTPADSATYYCAVTFLYDLTFGQGTFLIVKDQSLKNKTLIQQENVPMAKAGDSVSRCTVVMKRCTEEYSVYWFRHSSRESQSQIIHTTGQSSGQCKKSRSASSPQQTCVYHLPKNLSLSASGTYYCAVAACGEILFGNGTKVDIEDGYSQVKVFVLLAIIRSAVLLIIFIVCLISACTCALNK